LNQEGRKKWYELILFVILCLVLEFVFEVFMFYQRIALSSQIMLIVSVILVVLVIACIYYLRKKYPEITNKVLYRDKKFLSLFCGMLLLAVIMVIARILR
jgi:uncharacterized membrane protein